MDRGRDFKSLAGFHVPNLVSCAVSGHHHQCPCRLWRNQPFLGSRTDHQVKSCGRFWLLPQYERGRLWLRIICLAVLGFKQTSDCYPLLAVSGTKDVVFSCSDLEKMVLSTPCSSAALHYYLHVHWTTMFPFVFFSCFTLSSTVLWDDGIIFRVVANCWACRLSPHRQYRRRLLMILLRQRARRDVPLPSCSTMCSTPAWDVPQCLTSFPTRGMLLFPAARQDAPHLLVTFFHRSFDKALHKCSG